MISSNSLRNDVPIVELSSIVEFLDHKRKPITDSERVSGPYPYYGANGIQDYVADWIFDEELILLAEDGGHFEDPDRGVAYKISGKSWVNNHAHVLRPTNVDVDYLKHILRNMDLMPYVNGATRLKLTKANASRIKIPLPPLAEQKRIAEQLDTVDRIMLLREQAIAKLDELVASKYDEMFASNASNENACLGECLTFINGRAYSQHELLDEGTPIIRIQNLNGGNKWYYSNLTLPTDKYCTNGDLLFAWSATFGPYIWTGDKSIYHYHIWKIETSKMIHKTFAYYLLQSITQKIKSASHGASMLHMTKAGMEAWKFHLPSIERQIEFASIANSIESTKAKYSGSNTNIKTLFSSLQHQSFALN